MRDIHSFLEVDIPENTLVLCDIDDTLLRYYKTLNDCYNDVLETIESMSQHREFGDDFKTTTLVNKDRILEIAKLRYQHHQWTEDPIHKDKHGFQIMLDKINETNGRLAFLTARTKTAELITRQHFQALGLNYDDFSVYYTQCSGLSKSKYLLEHLQEMGTYANIIVIDDRCDLLEEIETDFPNIETYCML